VAIILEALMHENIGLFVRYSYEYIICDHRASQSKQKRKERYVRLVDLIVDDQCSHGSATFQSLAVGSEPRGLLFNLIKAEIIEKRPQILNSSINTRISREFKQILTGADGNKLLFQLKPFHNINAEKLQLLEPPQRLTNFEPIEKQLTTVEKL
jgi:hypothetical protein